MRLVTDMIEGYEAYEDIFPNANVPGLIEARKNFEGTKHSEVKKAAAERIATISKEEAFSEMKELISAELKKSEFEVSSDPDKLGLIGWGAKLATTPVHHPASPRNLDASVKGQGKVSLDWKKPADSGVACEDYVVERREQSAGGRDFGKWTQVAVTVDQVVELTDQPHAIQIEYRVKARNLGGESDPSNSVVVVL